MSAKTCFFFLQQISLECAKAKHKITTTYSGRYLAGPSSGPSADDLATLRGTAVPGSHTFFCRWLGLLRQPGLRRSLESKYNNTTRQVLLQRKPCEKCSSTFLVEGLSWFSCCQDCTNRDQDQTKTVQTRQVCFKRNSNIYFQQ